MTDRSVGHEVSRVLMRMAVGALFIVALLACGILSGSPAPTPTAPAGMFSTPAYRQSLQSLATSPAWCLS